MHHLRVLLEQIVSIKGRFSRRIDSLEILFAICQMIRIRERERERERIEEEAEETRKTREMANCMLFM